MLKIHCKSKLKKKKLDGQRAAVKGNHVLINIRIASRNDVMGTSYKIRRVTFQ